MFAETDMNLRETSKCKDMLIEMNLKHFLPKKSKKDFISTRIFTTDIEKKV